MMCMNEHPLLGSHSLSRKNPLFGENANAEGRKTIGRTFSELPCTSSSVAATSSCIVYIRTLYKLDRHHVVISHVFLYALFNYRIECRRQLAAYHLHIVRIYTAWDALVAQENHRF
jgi:hypothetical protein